jgi:hypothetical protein
VTIVDILYLVHAVSSSTAAGRRRHASTSAHSLEQ